MERTEVTYGQLDKLLRGHGFSVRIEMKDVEARLYEQKHVGALIILPNFPLSDHVLEYHLAYVRFTLDQFGIVDSSEFLKKLPKAS